MLNALSFDVEEWFQVTSFESVVKAGDWGTYESRVVGQTERILDVLLHYKTRATFFVLGYVAERYPGLIKKIAGHGHELAVHGHLHRLVCSLTPDEFEKEIVTSKQIVEDISGQEVIGYRAPSFSITDNTRWAFEILEENGFKYDSSIIPGRLRYGVADAKEMPYHISGNGNLIEFPVSTFNVLGKLIPFSGGLFFRFFPYLFIKSNIRRLNRKRNPAMLYIHPWEIDVDHPRIQVSFKPRFIHYFNLKSTESKLRSLLCDFQCGTIKEVLGFNE